MALDLKKTQKVSKIYNSLKINERHRHRYEVNINYKEKFESKGMIFQVYHQITNCQKLLN